MYFIEPIHRALLEPGVRGFFHDVEVQSVVLCLCEFLPVGVGLNKQALLSRKLSQTR